MEVPFKDDGEVLDLVRRFESCEINPEDFRHYQHLTVALYYLRQFPYDLASRKVRDGIQNLAAAYGKSGYHETITLFWLTIVRDFSLSVGPESLWQAANQLAAKYDKNLLRQYYSEEVITSAEAKS